MLGFRRETRLTTERLILRPPRYGDYQAWAAARFQGREHLQPWEPVWPADHLTRRAFLRRTGWAARSAASGSAWHFLLTKRTDGAIAGAITLDNIRRGPAQAGTLGYWTAAAHIRQGYMLEAIAELRRFAFDELDLGRIEAGCLPENTASRALLEKADFRYEGVARAYLQINGRWRDHVLYAALREDRRNRAPRRGGSVAY